MDMSETQPVSVLFSTKPNPRQQKAKLRIGKTLLERLHWNRDSWPDAFARVPKLLNDTSDILIGVSGQHRFSIKNAFCNRSQSKAPIERHERVDPQGAIARSVGGVAVAVLPGKGRQNRARNNADIHRHPLKNTFGRGSVQLRLGHLRR